MYAHLGQLCLFPNEGRCKNTWCSLKTHYFINKRCWPLRWVSGTVDVNDPFTVKILMLGWILHPFWWLERALCEYIYTWLDRNFLTGFWALESRHSLLKHPGHLEDLSSNRVCWVSGKQSFVMHTGCIFITYPHFLYLIWCSCTPYWKPLYDSLSVFNVQCPF